jgi:hypothetical protein
MTKEALFFIEFIRNEDSSIKAGEVFTNWEGLDEEEQGCAYEVLNKFIQVKILCDKKKAPIFFAAMMRASAAQGLDGIGLMMESLQLSRKAGKTNRDN